jgi:gluconolactonase
MNARTVLTVTLSLAGTLLLAGQSQAQQTGPGVQATRDANYQGYLASHCKNPPAPAAPFVARAQAAAPPPHRDYTVSAIPGVIAAGQTWTTVWTGTGNNADGPVATPSGAVLFAQNTDSKVMQIDARGSVSYPYADTNTGGALSRNTHGALFIVQRGLSQEIWQLEPKRQRLASQYNGEPLDCTGGLLNDLTADAKGGVYFTMGGVYHADAKGVVRHYGTLTGANGIILSRDEKTLYVTGRLASAPAATPSVGRPGGLVAYDVQRDGSLANERQFALVGDDGSAVDSQGRIYSTGGAGVQVVDKDGTVLGEIPSPLPLITVMFSGPDKKTLYGVANTQQFVEIFTLPMIAQGFKGRAK